MAVFTKEQLNVLYEAEIHFESVRHGYIKSVPRWLTDQVADIYEAATGQKVNRHWSCSQCVADLYQKVGKIYFEDKKEYLEKNEDMTQSEYTTGGSTISNIYVGEENETAETEVTEDQNKVIEAVVQPKRRGRPKKQNTEE